MWVANNSKERAKAYLRSDIESNITNITGASSRIHDTVAAINHSVGNCQSGADKKMIDDCRRALQELSNALHSIYMCRDFIERLDTREWVDDEQL